MAVCRTQPHSSQKGFRGITTPNPPHPPRPYRRGCCGTPSPRWWSPEPTSRGRRAHSSLQRRGELMGCNHGMAEVGGHLKAHPPPTPVHGLVVPPQIRLPVAPSNPASMTALRRVLGSTGGWGDTCKAPGLVGGHGAQVPQVALIAHQHEWQGGPGALQEQRAARGPAVLPKAARPEARPCSGGCWILPVTSMSSIHWRTLRKLLWELMSYRSSTPWALRK